VNKKRKIRESDSNNTFDMFKKKDRFTTNQKDERIRKMTDLLKKNERKKKLCTR